MGTVTALDLGGNMAGPCTVEELRFVSGSSNKFYRAYVLTGGPAIQVIFQWGRRGAAGQSKLVPVRTASEARSVAADQLRSKRWEGYAQAWEVQDLDPFPLPPQATLAKHLAQVWRHRQQELLQPSLAAVPAAVGATSRDAVLLLHRFDVEERSEVLAGTLAASLGAIPHARGRHGCAVAVPADVAVALASGYSCRYDVLFPGVPVDSAFLEVLVGLWDPTATGPLSSPQGALEMALAIV